MIHKIRTNMAGLQKYIKAHPRKNLTGFLNYGDRPLSHREVKLIVDYAVLHGYETEADIPGEEVELLLNPKPKGEN
jgi:hypothetical protein